MNGRVAMEYWIDGYNVILRKRWNDRGTLEQAREKLLSAVIALGVPVRVYFDASKTPGGHGSPHSRSSHVVPVFVRQGTADDAMADDLRNKPKSQITVVTDDRELRGRARQLGANTCGVNTFVAKLDKTISPVSKPRRHGRPTATGDKPGRVSKKDVDDWMRYFGFDDEEEPTP